MKPAHEKLTAARYRGTPCGNCGCTVRYKCNGKCAHCTKTATTARRKRQHYSTFKTRAVKNEVIAAYGGRCACQNCPEHVKPHREFLTVDHEIPCGYKNREPTNMLYRRLRREGYPKGYRVLCYNGNSGRSRVTGICPHAED